MSKIDDTSEKYFLSAPEGNSPTTHKEKFLHIDKGFSPSKGFQLMKLWNYNITKVFPKCFWREFPYDLVREILIWATSLVSTFVATVQLGDMAINLDKCITNDIA